MSNTMIRIDGSEGEGGGQVLRTALALSMIHATPFRIENIRAKRAKPGLLRQHLTAVRAAARVSSAHVVGDDIGSASLTFEPGPIAAGDYRFAIGSAGSATLVLQTILPALMRANGVSHVVIEGGTHNPMAPCADFLQRAFAPLVKRAGCAVDIRLERHGFYPAGGGRIAATVTPGTFTRLVIDCASKLVSLRPAAIVAGLPGSIAVRELALLANLLGFDRAKFHPTELHPSMGPGNAVIVDVERDDLTEVFWACGDRGLSAERVAKNVVDEVREYLASEAPIGPHLADQLVLVLAIAAGGEFVTCTPTGHLRTQLDVIEMFTGKRPILEQQSTLRWRVAVA